MKRYGLFVALIISAGLVFACAQAAQQTRRQRFKAAWGAIQQGDMQRADTLMSGLHGYVLYPYLVFARLDRRVRRLPGVFDDDAAAARFIATHQGWAIAHRLRADWLRSLAYRKRWSTFLKHYHGSRSSGLQCAAVSARLHLHPGSNTALNKAMKLWLHGYSQPRQCDAVFARLAERGRLTPTRIQQRLDLALDDGHFSLARYLARRLPTLAEKTQLRRIELFAKPRTALERTASQDGGQPPTAWVAEALQRLAGDAPDDAIGLLKRLDRRYRFTADQRQNIARRIAEGLAWDHDPRAIEWFQRVQPAYNTTTSRQWRIRAALYQRRWHLALHWIDRLPAWRRQHSQWRYWRARALAATGHRSEARRLYRGLSDGDGYYALLAADRAGQRYHFDSHALASNAALQQRIRALPGIVRAQELFRVDLPGYARQAWRHALEGHPASWYRQAALVARGWGWVDQSIRALVRGGAGDDLQLRYPTAFAPVVLHQAHTLSLQPSWIYGIMRSESLFSTHARSRTGALGLMQLMPATARDVARRVGLRLTGPDALFRPQVNVRLGSHYLRRMTERFDGSLVAATAAYNAGPQRVATWLPRRAIAADLWVDNIPYVETRRYVKRVMAYTTIFYWRLHHRTLPLSRHMGAVPPAQDEIVASRQ